MTTQNKKIPQLRFPEFNGEWEKKKLGELGKYYNGLSGKTAVDFGSGEPYIQYKQIFDNNYINDDYGFVLIKKDENQSKVKYGDVLFTTSSETPDEVAMSSVFLTKRNENIYLNSFSFGFRINSFNIFNPQFARFFLRSYPLRKKIFPLAQGSTRYNISKLELMKLKIHLPTLPEQEKIADFLSAVESRVQKLGEKLEALKRYKKGVMQQIFSQEIRFKDDRGNPFPNWEKKKLGEIGKIITGSTPKTAIKEYYNGEYLFVTPGDIKDNRFISDTERKVTKKGLKEGRIIQRNSIVFVCIGSIGNVAQVTSDCITNQQINSIVPNKENNSGFIYYLMAYHSPRIKTLSAIQVLPIINKTTFQDIILHLPTLPEQKKIANFLSSIDKKIELTQQELEHTECYKKGLLQRMFV